MESISGQAIAPAPITAPEMPMSCSRSRLVTSPDAAWWVAAADGSAILSLELLFQPGRGRARPRAGPVTNPKYPLVEPAGVAPVVVSGAVLGTGLTSCNKLAAGG